MSELLMSKQVAMGTTPDGRAWALKALHPADPTCSVVGIPDENAVPSVFQNYTRQMSIANPTPGTSGIWSADVYFLAHPIVLASICTYDSAGNYAWSYMLNESFGASGDSYATRKDLFATQVENYRLGYMSATCHLDAAAVTDQGMVAVAQYPITPVKCGKDASTAAPGYCQRSILAYNELPKTYSQLLTLPNSYSGNARDGCYSVYRLTKTHQEWRNARNVHAFIPYGNASGLTSAISGVNFAAGAPAGTTVSGLFPYGMGGTFTGCTVTDSLIHDRCDDGVLHVSFQNMHYLSSIVLTYRHGLELRVSPGSPLIAFLHAPAKYDAQAIDAYFSILRELKDGYPESYNSLGKLGSILWSVAKELLTNVPGGGLIASGAEALYNKVKQGKKMRAENASLADIEEQQRAVREKAALAAKSAKASQKK